MSGNLAVMGRRANGPWLSVLGWAATALAFAAAAGLVMSWVWP